MCVQESGKILEYISDVRVLHAHQLYFNTTFYLNLNFLSLNKKNDLFF